MQLATQRAVNEVIVHCAATPEGRDFTTGTIRQWHLDRGFRDVGYHFVIRLDGSIEVGRPLDEIGAHVRGRNTGTIGVCYVGSVTNDEVRSPKDTRTRAQKRALRHLLTCLADENPNISRISTHRDYAAKAYPSFDATTGYRDILQPRLAS